MSVIDEKWKIVEDEVARHGWDKSVPVEFSEFSFGDSVTVNERDGILVGLTPTTGTVVFNANENESREGYFTFMMETFEIKNIKPAS